MLDKTQTHEIALTSRQTRVLRLLAQGLTNKEIAREIGGSPRSLEIYVRRLKDKIGATNRAHLTALAIGLGVVGIVAPLRADK